MAVRDLRESDIHARDNVFFCTILALYVALAQVAPYHASPTGDYSLILLLNKNILHCYIYYVLPRGIYIGLPNIHCSPLVT